jgi:hypothetical protein
MTVRDPRRRATTPRIDWSPESFVFRDRAEPILRATLAELRLNRLIREVQVRVDVDDFGDDAHIRWSLRAPYSVCLDVALGNFLSRDGRRRLARTRPHHSQISGRRFAGRTFEGTILHELTHLRDDALHGIDCGKIPRALRTAFNEVWNVWIDGRLRRRGAPTVTKSERLAIFGLIFGAVRGQRREVFEQLWNSERLSHQELVEHMEILGQ